MGFLREGSAPAAVERVTLSAPDAQVPVVHAAPEGDAAAAIVIHPDLGGVRPLFDEIARRLATHGYAVMAPEPFARRSPADRESKDPAERMSWIPGLDDADQVGDLVRAADWLAQHHGVDAIGVTGFCMGGHYALKAAASGRFARAVVFYGMITTPPDWDGPGHRSPLETIGDVCPTLALLGAVDPYTPEDDIAELRAAFAGRDDCEIVIYDEADHGFVHDPERDAHRAGDAADAWERTLAWFADLG